MLTLPLLILCWGLAILSLGIMVWRLTKRKWLGGFLGYFFTGFFAIALPFKIGLHATSFLGMMFLSLIWPIWLGQHWFGYHVLAWFPDQFWTFMFNL